VHTYTYDIHTYTPGQDRGVAATHIAAPYYRQCTAPVFVLFCLGVVHFYIYIYIQIAATRIAVPYYRQCNASVVLFFWFGCCVFIYVYKHIYINTCTHSSTHIAKPYHRQHKAPLFRVLFGGCAVMHMYIYKYKQHKLPRLFIGGVKRLFFPFLRRCAFTLIYNAFSHSCITRDR